MKGEGIHMNKIILITGASSGIGKAITEYLASKDCVVYAGARKDRDIDALNTLNNVKGIRLDVTSDEEIDDAVKRIKKEQGHIDCLINNAGIMGWGAVIDRTIDYYSFVFNVNVFGAVRMVKACYPLLTESTNNPIIFNISSQGENYTMPFWSPYMMSKHAMKAFSSTLRREMMSVGIRVVGIAPGAFKSNMLNSQKEALDKYEATHKSVFTPMVVKLLGIPVRNERKHEKSPLLIGKLLYKLLDNPNPKVRYQPGRKFFPDVILDKFPAKLVDKIFIKILKKNK
ncbi:MAG: SDR family oxidoreductase [Chitinispirillia bacterium]|jgi:NAD(P)-dependent dehydrogenase (short-subunit alcohol dehydrogenase family)